MKKPTTLKIVKSIVLLLILITIQFSFLNCQPEKDSYDPPQEDVKTY